MKKPLIVFSIILGITSGVFAQTNTFPSSGNVGIGTTSPGTKLEVIGKIQTTGDEFRSFTNGIDLRFGSETFAVGQAAVGTLSNHPLRFYTNSSAVMTLLASGNVGIGTTNPNAKLDIEGTPGVVQLLVQPSSTGTAIAKIASNGNGHAHLDFDAAFANYIDFLSAGTSKWRIGRPSGTYDFEIYNSNLSTSSLLVQSSTGNVGIGTTNTGPYKLAVEGTIGARKVKVTQINPWADYVFNDDYLLLPLNKLEKYIQQNKHLPEVPSAAEVEKNGLDLGENQAVLLKKIEELTLYVIELKKENEKMNEKLEMQQEEIQSLKNKQNKK
jgi:hypothetical protein